MVRRAFGLRDIPVKMDACLTDAERLAAVAGDGRVQRLAQLLDQCAKAWSGCMLQVACQLQQRIIRDGR